MRKSLIALAAMALGTNVFAETGEKGVLNQESDNHYLGVMVESTNNTILQIHENMVEMCDDALDIMTEYYSDGTYDEGYDDGYDDGYDEGYDDAKVDVYWQEHRPTANAYIRAIEDAVDDVNDLIDRNLVVCWDGDESFDDDPEDLYLDFDIIDLDEETCDEEEE